MIGINSVLSVQGCRLAKDITTVDLNHFVKFAFKKLVNINMCLVPGMSWLRKTGLERAKEA